MYRIVTYIYIYIYIYSDCHFFAEGHLLNSLRVPLEANVNPQAKYILANLISCVADELAVFSIDTHFSDLLQVRLLC